jgi:hypothetical protein
MSDYSKCNQRNIRIPPELWAYVQSLSKDGNCSAVIRRWIMERMADDPNYKPQH